MYNCRILHLLVTKTAFEIVLAFNAVQWFALRCLSLAVVVNLVLLRHVAVVKTPEDVFAWSVDCATKEEV